MKKFIIPGAIVLVIILAIVIQLVSNKKELDEARKPVDRTKIPVAVKVAKVEKKELELQTQYPAMTKPYEDAKIYSQSSGIIDYLTLELGTKVAKDQVVGKLDTRILQLNLKEAQIAYEKAMDDYYRAKDLYENKAGLKVDMLTTKANFDKAQNQVDLIQEQLRNARIVAPISGIVYAHTVKEGEFINPGTPIASVSNVFLLKATVYVAQQMAYQLKIGQQGMINTPVLEGEKFYGEIIYISPVADANHNYQVDLLVQQKEGVQLKGGTDVQVVFETLKQKEALQIPKSALMTDTEEPYVFVIESEKAVEKEVKIGVAKRDQVEVLSGLQEGETIVVTGQINLRDGSKVSIIK